ncbi:MAG: TrkH family potassium uptake protein [Halobacteriaceae archaeon]
MRVDWRASASLVGTVLQYLTLTFAIPVAVALVYGEGLLPFVATAAVTLGAGTALARLDADPDLGAREGFLMVAATWLAVALVGALPYVFAGEGTVALPVNALFESMSGFTTTGATVMGDISFDTHSRALMMWRQLTQWLGGMGIVVLAVAVLPELSVGGAQLMDAEAPGPGIQKLTPRIAETARALWGVYLGFTVLEIVLLYGLNVAGLAPAMTPYNAVAHGFTTLPTGGFSPEARSIEAFSAAVQWLIIPFMVVAGTNFALFWYALNGNVEKLRDDSEFRFYCGVIAAFTAVTAGALFTGSGLAVVPAEMSAIVGDVEPALRHAAFQVVSIVTTTGYASMDFNAWGAPSKMLLFVALFVGGSAGSTGGAIKIVRWLVILKSIRRELFTTVHPDDVRPVRLGGRALDERALRGIYAFTLLYVVLFALGTMLVMLDAGRVGYGVTGFEAMSAVAATLGNVGPGFGAVGPMNSYVHFPATSKLLMVVLMWFGRLEILPVLVLFTASYWRR